jgi:hypothetical protein
MPVITLTTTSASNQTWTVPSDLPVGRTAAVEVWGAGSGGSGAGAGGFGAGGAGGAYATDPTYTITPNDVTSGITFFSNTGSAGTANANSAAGPNTFFSTNNVNLNPSTIVSTTTVGTPGSLPPNWYYFGQGTLTVTTQGFGIDSNTGIPYVDVHVSGTTSTTNFQISFMGNLGAVYGGGGAVAVASTQYTYSFYCAMTAGSTTNITHIGLESDNSAAGYYFFYITPTASFQRFTGTNTWGATALTNQGSYIFIQFTSGVAIDITLRVGGCQIEQAASATAFRSTPGYVFASGGSGTTGTTTPLGGVGGATATSIGATKNAGGSGATKAQGGGGGGAAGKDGAGLSSTTATGAAGDNGSGGAAGVSNVEGGGGGTASAAAGGTGGAGGAPGAGGGGETGASGTRTGGTGGRGQVRITYTGVAYPPLAKPWKQRRMLMR